MKSDIEISNESKKLDIEKIAKKINIEKYIEKYGNDKAKISLSVLDDLKDKENGKLILVTSINPTPFGEGKTTMSIGIDDALNRIGKKSIVVLREPSLGPVFGIKGGATGGGYSQVMPMEDINLHFTGDLHAISSANNLLSAIIDNHIWQGNQLQIDTNNIYFNRCVDLNDRALRDITIHYEKRDIDRKESYNITAASEVMAILCLASDLMDLKKRLGSICIGKDINGKLITASDLHAEDALTILLKDAIKPNLVQTLENNPAIIHGGPFANIAHGCNSIIATKMGLKIADYVVTEAGFGADLGAEKFLDIKCQLAKLKPNAVVVNATIRSLKYNGNVDKTLVDQENLEALKIGIVNLKTHIENVKKYVGNNIIVCLNKFYKDTDKEIEYVKDFVTDMGVEFSICESFSKGSKGAVDLANKLVNICNNKVVYKPIYKFNEDVITKITKVTKEIYRAGDVIISDDIKQKILDIENNGYGNLPVCIAKTQYSFSDDPKKLGSPIGYTMTIRDVKLCLGSGFIVVYMGSIMTMPGLGKNSAYQNMSISKNGTISGLF